MKFACDRCGKRYASVDEPAEGRVYRIRCRCGHVIMVRGPGTAPRRDAGEEPRGLDLPPALTAEGEREPTPPPLVAAGAREGQPAPLPPAGEREPSPPPLAEARGDPPSGSRPPGEDAASIGPRTDAAPARGAARGVEPPAGEDPFLRAAKSAAPQATPEGSWNDEGWGADPPGRGDGVLAAEHGGVAALSLGLDEGGAAGARWRALRLAVILALVALAGALAMWRA